MKKNIIVLIIVLTAFQAYAQDVLTIERTLEIAMKNSPDVRRSENDVRRNLEFLKAQEARQKAQMSLSANPLELAYSRRKDREELDYYDNRDFSTGLNFRITQPVMPTGGTIGLTNSFDYAFGENNKSGIWRGSDSYTHDLRLSFDQPLFTYNRLKVQLEELELSFERSSIGYSLTKLRLELNVRQLFFNLYQMQQSLAIAKEELKNNEASYEIIKNKVEAGLSAVEELYQAELNVASSRSDVYNKEVNLNNAKDNFLYNVGLPINYDFMVMANIGVEKIIVDEQKAVDLALNNRLELRQRQIDIEVKKFDLIDSKTRNEFSGSLSASVGVTNQTILPLYNNNAPTYIYADPNTMYDNPTFTPRISLTFDIPVFDWGERRAMIKAAELALETSEMDLENERIEIQLEVRKIIRNLTNLYNQIDIARKNVENAQLTYEINLERYKNGDLTSMDLSLFQNQLSNKKNALTGAIIDYNLELLNLKIQTLYDFITSETVIPEKLIK